MTTFELDSEERKALEAKLEAGIRHTETFTRRFFGHIGAKVVEDTPGVLHVEIPKDKVPVQRSKHILTFDPEIYSTVEDEGAELVTPSSPLFRRMLSVAEQLGPMGVVKTRRATPYTLFHFHVHLEGLNYEWDELVSVAVDDEGDPVADSPDVEELFVGIEQDRFQTVEPANVPEHLRRIPATALDKAPLMLRQDIAGKLDELAGAIEAGLRKTHERIQSYYEQMRDEIRGEEVKLRRRIGELNSKIWYTEDNIRLMKLEKEREILTKDLNEIKGKTQRSLDHLELEESERLAKESERAQPKVRIALAAATRVLV